MVEDISVNPTYGYLEFKDLTVFDEAKKSLETMEKEEIDDWESGLDGFNSLRSIYEMALIEEEKYFEDLSESGSNLDIETNSNLHSDFLKERLDIFILNDGIIELDIPPIEKGLEAFVNKDGIISIGGVIYQYSKDKVKIIRDGNEESISSLVNIEESIPDDDIFVHDLQIRELNFSEKSNLENAFSGDEDCSGYTGGGGQRVDGRAWSGVSVVVDVFGNYGYPGQTVYQARVGTTATNYKKNFGWNKKRTGQLRIDGVINYSTNITSIETANLSIDTGGDLEKSIGRTIYVHPWINSPVYIYSFYGSLTFQGRHGSTCSI